LLSQVIIIMDKKKLGVFQEETGIAASRTGRRMVSRTEQDGRTVDEGSAQDIAGPRCQLIHQGISLSSKQQRSPVAAMVEGALERLREGEFGECIACGRKSPPSAWKLCPGLGIASNAKRNSNRESWKRLRVRCVEF